MTFYGRSEELVSWCVECDLAEPESLASLGGSAPGLVDGILSQNEHTRCLLIVFSLDADRILAFLTFAPFLQHVNQRFPRYLGSGNRSLAMKESKLVKMPQHGSQRV